DAVFRRSEEQSAVAPPIRFHLHIELEVFVLLVGDQDSTAAERTLGANEHAVHRKEVRRRPVDVGPAAVPPGEILSVEDWREAFGHLDRQWRELESCEPFAARPNLLRRGWSGDRFQLIRAWGPR